MGHRRDGPQRQTGLARTIGLRELDPVERFWCLLHADVNKHGQCRQLHLVFFCSRSWIASVPNNIVLPSQLLNPPGTLFSFFEKGIKIAC